MSRFTINFAERVDKDLEQMRETLHVTTKGEVIRKALNLLRYILQEEAKGSTLVFINKEQNTQKEIVHI